MPLVTCKMIIEKPVEQLRDELPQIIRAGLKHFMLEWHDQTAPKHFRQEAITKWKYERRSAKYQKMKERRRLQPLMFSGESRRRLLQSIRVALTGKSPVKATGMFDAPRYFWMRPAGHPDKGGEFMKVNSDEANALAQNLNEYVHEEFDKLKGIKEEVQY